MKKNIFVASMIAAAILSTINIVSAEEVLNINNETIGNQSIVSDGFSVKVDETVWKWDAENNVLSKIDGSQKYSLDELLNGIDNKLRDPLTDEVIGEISGYNYGAAVNAVGYDTVNITNSVFTNNKVSVEGIDTAKVEMDQPFAAGGAVYAHGNLNITNAEFINNSASAKYTFSGNNEDDTDLSGLEQKISGEGDVGIGGAIYNVGELSIDNANFESNSATYGGAIYNKGTVSIKNSDFINNKSFSEYKYNSVYTYNGEETSVDNTSYDGYGGALTVVGDLTVDSSKFIGNLAAERGGAVSASGNVTVTNSIFQNNTALSESKEGYYSIDEDTEEMAWNDESGKNGYGGAIFAYSSDNTNKLLVENSSFEGNTSGLIGGAIATYIDTDISNSIFSSNQTGENGGAISALYNGYNAVTLNVNNSVFENNKVSTTQNNDGNTSYEWTTVSGGAITAQGNVTIKNSQFSGNSVESKNTTNVNYDGGEIIQIKLSGEESTGYGGAVAIFSYNDNSDSANTSTLDIDNSVFENNSAASYGGAVYTYGNLNIANSEFTNNSSVSPVTGETEYTMNGETTNTTSEYYNGYGGAVAIAGDLTVKNSTFTGNTAAIGGGAIIHQGGDITVKNSVFTNNTALSKNISSSYTIDENGEKSEENTDETVGYGGALAAEGPMLTTAHKLVIDNSTFEGNSSGNGGGGAIYTGLHSKITNSLFSGNSTEGNGGAIIQTYGNMDIADTDFINNSAKIGGAIYTGDEDFDSSDGNVMPELSITALSKDVLFSGNNADKGGDIYAQNTIINLNANENKSITFNDGIVGKNSIININDKTKNLYDDLNSTGTVVINNFVSPDENSTLAVNLNAGTLKLAKENYLDGTDLTLEEGSVLDLSNNSTGEMNLNSLTSNNSDINIDMDLSNSAFDTIKTDNASGVLNLKNVNLLSDFAEDTNKLTANVITSEDLELKTSENGINILTNDYLYTVNTNNNQISVNRLVDDDGNALVIDGFTLAVNQTDKVGGVDINLSDERSFSANQDIKITGGTEKGWTGELGGTSLTVNGNGYTLDGEKNSAMLVNNGQTLTFNDTSIKGFATSDDRKGTLTVKDGGVLSINAVNNDILLGDTDETSNIIYLDGSSSKAFLTTTNNKNITVNNDIRSNDAGNELTLSGNGKITFNGIVDPLTLTNENAETVHNNYIDGVNYNINSGIVTFGKDEYLNGQGNKNTLNLNGGTLNIANGSVGLIDLAALNLNSTSNIMLDADLANEAMDRITADSVTAETDAMLNVSSINLLSYTTKDKVEINAVDPTIQLENGETLASHISSSVASTAYSPIYKYAVGYDSTTGNFSFTSGSSSNYNNLNPAIMVAPVAAQAGGYMSMLDTYNNAFTSMDMRMLAPSAARIASKNANKYAISDASTGQPQYKSTEYTSGGIYVRPYAAFDSVKMKNGPKVNNTSYGSFIGGDSAVHHFKNGVETTISPYIAYQGNHQNYSGNSVFQNGGTFGIATALYKGKFFTGLTAGVGANVSEASTMYGHEDFPMVLAGVANKTGYNIEFKDGKFIIQPSLMLSYTYVNTMNYTNAAGVKVEADPLHALQIAPAVKFVMNTENGWQPYATFGVLWNLIDETKFTANEVSLPELSIKPYFQYGLGVQKLIGDRFTAYGQVMIRNGGRNGIAATFGGRYLLGHENI